MPRVLLVLGLCFVVSCGDDGGGGAKPTPEPEPEAPADPLAAPLAELRARSREPVSLGVEGGFPSVVLGRFPARGDTRGERAKNFVADAAELYGQTSSRLVLDVRRSGASVLGSSTLEHATLHQTVDGVPVEGGELSVILDGDEVVGALGRLLPASIEVDTRPNLVAADAVARVRTLRPDLADAPLEGVPTLVVWDRSLIAPELVSEPHLAFRLTLGGTLVYLDARSARILQAVAPERALTGAIRKYSEGAPYLIWELGSCVDPEECDRAAQLFGHFQTVGDHYLNRHGWLSFDGMGALLKVFVNSPKTTTWAAI